jgi:hypothetical protein
MTYGGICTTQFIRVQNFLGLSSEETLSNRERTGMDLDM